MLKLQRNDCRLGWKQLIFSTTVSQAFFKLKLVDIGQIKLKGHQPLMLER